MRRLISDLCFTTALLLGIVVAAQAQFNSFPPGVFTGRAALAPAPGGGGGTVTFDASGTITHSGNGTSFDLTTLTVGSGSNRALVAMVTFGTDTPSPVLTWDSGGTNQSMTQIDTNTFGAGSGTVFLFGLIAPTSGNKTLHFAWTGTDSVAVQAVAFTGVNQTGGATSFNANGKSTGTGAPAATMTITSATGDIVVGAYATKAGSFTSIDGTSLGIDNTPANDLAAAYYSGSASVSSNTTRTTGSNWESVAVDVVHN